MPIDQARDQLSWRYGHFRRSKTGVLDFFFDRYAERFAQTGTGFREWIADEYDPVPLKAEFRGGGLVGNLIDGVLRRE